MSNDINLKREKRHERYLAQKAAIAANPDLREQRNARARERYHTIIKVDPGKLAKTRERARKYTRERYNNDPEFKEYVLGKSKEWRQKDRKHVYGLVERSRIKRILNEHQERSEKDQDCLSPDFILDLIYREKTNDENTSQGDGNTTSPSKPGRVSDIQPVLVEARPNSNKEGVKSITPKRRETVFPAVRGTLV